MASLWPPIWDVIHTVTLRKYLHKHSLCLKGWFFCLAWGTYVVFWLEMSSALVGFACFIRLCAAPASGRHLCASLCCANSWEETRAEGEGGEQAAKNKPEQRRGGQKAVEVVRAIISWTWRWHTWTQIKRTAEEEKSVCSAASSGLAGTPPSGLFCVRTPRPPSTTQTSRHLERPLDLPSESQRNARRDAERRARMSQSGFSAARRQKQFSPSASVRLWALALKQTRSTFTLMTADCCDFRFQTCFYSSKQQLRIHLLIGRRFVDQYLIYEMSDISDATVRQFKDIKKSFIKLRKASKLRHDC